MLCRKRGLLGLLAIASTASAFPAQPFDLRSHGATGDGQSSDTAALQSAIGACAEAGGGQVHLPPCRYLSGTIHLRGGVTLHLEKGTRLGEFADKKCHAF